LSQETELSIITQLAEIRERQSEQTGIMSALAADMKILAREVRGNGQPGLVQRVTGLEESRAESKGVARTWAFIFSAVVGLIMWVARHVIR
jgi:orotidine-5'-phosphate decarboxylase